MSNSVALDALSRYSSIAADLHSSQTYKPFIYPHYILGPYLIIGYLLLPPIPSNSPISKPVFYLRYPIFAFATYNSICAMRDCRTATVTVGYGIGLISSWTLLWFATLIIFGDARGQFRRLEKRIRVNDGPEKTTDLKGDKAINATFTDPALRKLPRNNKTTNPTSPKEPDQPAENAASTYIISQPLPATFYHRLCWVSDLITNFRGINWTYGRFEPSYHSTRPRPPYLHPPPNIPTRRTLLRRTALSLSTHYILLDLLKTLTLLDPYFATYPPSTPSPFPIPRITRVLLSLISTYTALRAIFLLAPFSTQLLGPRILGAYADPELYPAYFGPLSQIATHGVAGLWGGAWHPLFRLAFESAGDFAARPLGPPWGARHSRGKALRTCVAFACSGFLHACGSYATLPPTRPLSRAFLFFALQPLGIFAQRIIAHYLIPTTTTTTFPPWMRKTGNWTFTTIWALATGPLIANDFAASGIWLFEPVPFSFWRRGRWCWGGGWVGVWRGERWWEWGLAF